MPRETAILDVFMSRLKATGNYPYVTYTSILKPDAERTYFHLVYATRHWRGLEEFRRAEQGAMEVQERVRFDVRQNIRAQRTGMNDMFSGSESEAESRRLLDRRAANLARAQGEVEALLSQGSRLQACDIWAVSLAVPLVTIKDAKKILIELAKQGRVVFELRERQRLPGADTIVRVV